MHRRLWLAALAVSILAFLILPVLIVIPMSFSASKFLEFPPSHWSLRWYSNFFSSSEWLAATWVSLRVGFFTVLVAVPLGVVAAYGLHSSASRLTRVFEIILLMPVIVPVIIVAIGVFYLYAQIGLVNTIPGLVLVDSVLAVPYVVVSMLAAFRRYDLNQERVARSLGATRLRAFLTITLPQLSRSVGASCAFAFFTAIDEVVIALFISGGYGSTLTKRMFTSLRDEVDPTIAAISTMLITSSIALMLLLQIWPSIRKILFANHWLRGGARHPLQAQAEALTARAGVHLRGGH
jgi:putative spermidine/putrescine transport system permease protein